MGISFICIRDFRELFKKYPTTVLPVFRIANTPLCPKSMDLSVFH